LKNQRSQLTKEFQKLKQDISILGKQIQRGHQKVKDKEKKLEVHERKLEESESLLKKQKMTNNKLVQQLKNNNLNKSQLEAKIVSLQKEADNKQNQKDQKSVEKRRFEDEKRIVDRDIRSLKVEEKGNLKEIQKVEKDITVITKKKNRIQC